MSSQSVEKISSIVYFEKIESTLKNIEAQIDQWLADDVIDIDGHRVGGVLELVFPDASKIVINQQAPLQELWVATKSGGFHFKISADKWCDTKDGISFVEKMQSAMVSHAKKPLPFNEDLWR